MRAGHETSFPNSTTVAVEVEGQTMFASKNVNAARRALKAFRLRHLEAIHSARTCFIHDSLPSTNCRWLLTVSSVRHASETAQPRPQENSTDPQSCSEVEYTQAKPFDAIPTPKRIPVLNISRDFVKFTPSRAVQFVQERVQQYGKLFREKSAPGLPEFLFVLDPEDVAKVFRADGRYPRRFPLWEWIVVRKQFNIPIGLFLS